MAQDLSNTVSRHASIVALFGMHQSVSVSQVAIGLVTSGIASLAILFVINLSLLWDIDLEQISKDMSKASTFTKARQSIQDYPIPEMNIFFDGDRQVLFAEIGFSSTQRSYETQNIELDNRTVAHTGSLRSNNQCRAAPPTAIHTLSEPETLEAINELVKLWNEISGEPTEVSNNNVMFGNAKRKHQYLYSIQEYANTYDALRAGSISEREAVLQILEDRKATTTLRSMGLVPPQQICLLHLDSGLAAISANVTTVVPFGALVRAYEEGLRFGYEKDGITCGVTRILDDDGRAVCSFTRAANLSFESGLSDYVSRIALLNLINGPFQYATLIALLLMLFVSGGRYFAAVTLDKKVAALCDSALRDSASPGEWHRQIETLINEVAKTLSGDQRAAYSFVTLAAYQTAYSVLHHTQNLSEVPASLANVRDSYRSRLASSWGITDYLQWLIPTTGFLGTIYGISASLALVPTMQSPDPIAVAYARIQVGEAVGVAFDTTFFALLAATISVLVDRITRGGIQAYIDQTFDGVWWSLSHTRNVSKLVKHETEKLAGVIKSAVTGAPYEPPAEGDPIDSVLDEYDRPNNRPNRILAVFKWLVITSLVVVFVFYLGLDSESLSNIVDSVVNMLGK